MRGYAVTKSYCQMLTAASTAVVEGPPAAVPIALRPGQNCFYCPRCELQEREGIQRG